MSILRWQSVQIFRYSLLVWPRTNLDGFISIVHVQPIYPALGAWWLSETMALSHCSLFRSPPRWKTCRIGITGLPAGSVSGLDGSRFIKHIRFEQAGEELRKVPDHKRHSRDKCPAWRHLSPWEYDHFVPFLFSNNILEHQAPGNVRIIQRDAKLW